MERKGIVTFIGNPCTLEGSPVKVGDKAPNFTVVSNALQPKSLTDYKGKILIISVVPSLDTGVCDTQTRRFNQEAVALGGQVQVLTISCDLPFAQARWCGAADVKQLETLSDYKDLSFGLAYGLVIKELRLLTRAVLIIDAAGTIRYMEVVPEVTHEVDFSAAFAAVKEIVG